VIRFIRHSSRHLLPVNPYRKPVVIALGSCATAMPGVMT
jgi:hypothetical protein